MKISGLTAEPRGERYGGKPSRVTCSVDILGVETQDALRTVNGQGSNAWRENPHVTHCTKIYMRTASDIASISGAIFNENVHDLRLRSRGAVLPI